MVELAVAILLEYRAASELRMFNDDGEKVLNYLVLRAGEI